MFTKLALPPTYQTVTIAHIYQFSFIRRLNFTEHLQKRTLINDLHSKLLCFL